MPRKKIVRKRKMKDDSLVDLLTRGSAIRETFAERKSQLRERALDEYNEYVSRWSREYDLPPEVVRSWLSRADGSTLPELAAKYSKARKV